MTKEEAVKHFGTQVLLCEALGIKSQGSVGAWREIPPLRQLQIERLTGGALKAGPECDPYRVPHREASDSVPGALDDAAKAAA